MDAPRNSSQGVSHKDTSRRDKLTFIALDIPFLLLPFRPTSDPSASRTFIRNYFLPQTEREEMRGETLKKELRLTEPMVIQS
jgi:hypothetical protein